MMDRELAMIALFAALATACGSPAGTLQARSAPAPGGLPANFSGGTVRVPRTDGHRLVLPVVEASATAVATSPDGKSRAVAVREAASGDAAVALFDEHRLARLVPGTLEDLVRDHDYSRVVDPSTAGRLVHGLGILTLPLDVESPSFARYRRGIPELVAWMRAGPAPATDAIPVFPKGSGVVVKTEAGVEYRAEGRPRATLRLVPSAAPVLAALNADSSALAMWDPGEGLSLVDLRTGTEVLAADTSEPLRALRFDEGVSLSGIGASGAILMFAREGQYGPLLQIWTVYELGDEGSVAIDPRGVIQLDHDPMPYEGNIVHCALGEDIVPFESCVAYAALE